MTQQVLFSVEVDGQWQDVVRIPDTCLNRIGLPGREKSYTITQNAGAQFIEYETARRAQQYSQESQRPLPWAVKWLNEAGETVNERRVMMGVQKSAIERFMYLRVVES